MIEIYKKAFKGAHADPVYNKLYKVIAKMHQPAEHTKKELMSKRHIKDICQEAVHFAVLPGDTTLYIHYTVDTWIKREDGGAWSLPVSIKSIGIYDDELEYTKARLKGLHSVGPGEADIPNIN